MKFGKFVGKKSIRMTAKEQSAFKAKFEKILKAYGNLNFQFDNIEEDNLGKYGYLE